MDVVEYADILHKEADALLYESGLLNIIQAYGVVQFTGSYASNLMTWRDIDLNLRLNNEWDVDTMWMIGQRIGTKYEIVKMIYSNHRLRDDVRFDYGLYWGIHVLFRNEAWKVDLWGIEPSRFESVSVEHRQINEQLKNVERRVILELKKALMERGDYRDTVYGMDVYMAVIEGKAQSLDDFDAWWADH
jgi:hypothetical protein